MLLFSLQCWFCIRLLFTLFPSWRSIQESSPWFFCHSWYCIVFLINVDIYLFIWNEISHGWYFFLFSIYRSLLNIKLTYSGFLKPERFRNILFEITFFSNVNGFLNVTYFKNMWNEVLIFHSTSIMLYWINYNKLLVLVFFIGFHLVILW